MFKNFISSKKGIYTCLAISLILIISILLLNTNEDHDNNSTDKLTNNKVVTKEEKQSKKEDTNEIDNQDSEEELIDDEDEQDNIEIEPKTESKTEYSNTTTSTEKNDTKVNSNESNIQPSNSSTNTQTVPIEPVAETTQVETPVEEKEDLSTIVDTNSFFYSIHKGNIETKTEADCLDAGYKIANKEIDEVMDYNKEHMNNQKQADIQYFRCYEVTSKANTIMGYYLNIFCESGNCDVYKNLIDMSQYK